MSHAITALHIGAHIKSVHVGHDRSVTRIGAHHAFDHATIALAGPAFDRLMGFPQSWGDEDEANVLRFAANAEAVEAARRRAARIVSDNLPLMERLGAVLCARGQLSGDEVAAVLGERSMPLAAGEGHVTIITEFPCGAGGALVDLGQVVAPVAPPLPVFYPPSRPGGGQH
jgi:hypothetical protein